MRSCSRRAKRPFSSPKHPDRHWAPPSFLLNGRWGLLSRMLGCRGAKLFTHLLVVLSVTMAVAVPPVSIICSRPTSRTTWNFVELFHEPTLMHNFLYSLTIFLLHYYPRHVSSINMPIFRRKNCIHTASGIFALCKRLHLKLVESGLQSALNQFMVQPFTESEDTRCCVNTIFPPEDGHVNARHMSRIIV